VIRAAEYYDAVHLIFDVAKVSGLEFRDVYHIVNLIRAFLYRGHGFKELYVFGVLPQGEADARAEAHTGTFKLFAAENDLRGVYRHGGEPVLRGFGAEFFEVSVCGLSFKLGMIDVRGKPLHIYGFYITHGY
jgi:hypothetical protein